ncbi:MULTISPECIES: hypothetical protein [Myxococcus]|uniref:hypothetical protein n=1 Tax=Myxococcus TaxID=32 RepID=UPI0011436C9F|nr:MULTISPECIES: hypothetical protein [Myxococcus]NOK05851.1 hypothetical protein [Myxococcus xanthus]
MSEHQVYEFVALDRPLTARQMAELRAISTRAEITPTRFWNEYHRGGLGADPAQLLLRYFDAHLYDSNWGDCRLMLRLPRAGLDVKALKACFPARSPSALTVSGNSVMLDFQVGDEDPSGREDAPSASLAALVPLRTELQRGDLRGAYLAWLGAVQAGSVASFAKEPLVPEELSTLSAAQQALVALLRLDEDLLAAAAHGEKKREDDSLAFRAWVRDLSPKDQMRWLLRAVDAPERPLGSELLRAFRAEHASANQRPARTVHELQALMVAQRAARERAESARARAATAAAMSRLQRRLTALSRDVDGAWARLEARVAASEYDEAVRLAEDLRALATRDDDLAGFAARFAALRGRQARRRGFFDRWKLRD